MTSFKHFFVTSLLVGCFIYSTANAADEPVAPCSYWQKVGSKAGLAFTNMTTGILEVPKSMAKTTNDSNVFYGLTGGLFKGFLNGIGRLTVGTLDLATLPIPTKPVVYPLHVWDDFNIDTSYNDIMRFDFCPPVVAEPVAVAPLVEPVAKPAPVAPRLPIDAASPQQINRQLDTLFKNRMQK